ncbi:MAG: GNAT family N-acetyltransferase [Clostridia bacterium]|nr:GNAT family N-acetyltransferase [Clostridia bacterium]
MLIDALKYKESLRDLWNVVFGDDYGYINCIYKEEYKNDILCFAEIENGKAVSAFYLLKNTLSFEGKSYQGYYLYSAATLPQYRKKGLMGKLIKEAELFCGNEGIDYISLVPANDELYNYYKKFGFQEAMHYWNNFFETDYQADFSVEIISNAETLKAMRKNYKGNMVDYCGTATDYAVAAMKKGKADFLKLSDSAYCCFTHENDDIAFEFICEQDKLEQELKKVLKIVSKPFCVVISPYDMSEFSIISFPKKFGMIYPINNELKRDWQYTDIYMNLALN